MYRRHRYKLHYGLLTGVVGTAADSTQRRLACGIRCEIRTPEKGVTTMSRTDKDMPWYAVTEYWVPDHWKCQNAFPGLFWWRGLGYRRQVPGARECDLPPEPGKPHHDHTARWRIHVAQHCVWVPDWDSVPYRGGSWHRVHSHPPGDFVAHVFHSPERRNLREKSIEARKQYRATGEVDEDLHPIKHRRNAAWLWY